MKKIVKVSSIVIMIISMIIIFSRARATEELEATIKLESESKIENGETITINVKLCDITKNIDTVIAKIEYNKEIFEEITEDDLTPINNWSYPTYNVNNQLFMIEKTNGTLEEETIMQISLKVKENISITSEKVKLTGLDVAGSSIDRIVNKEAEITIGDEVKEKLYLSSDVYKIGDNDIDNYEDSDIYVEKISPETTVAEFINNCKTNGTLTVINQDGEALEDDDLVGTNMTIKVTGFDEEYILKAVVMGDLDGNGLVTVTDLSGVNQAILKIIELKDAIFKAADLDDNEEITVTDLSGINQTILKVIELTYDKSSLE